MSKVFLLRFNFVFGFVFAVLITATLMLPSNPFGHLPGQDNGVFLYGGQQIIAGETPYLEFWDHKGPLIYFINALGLFLGLGSRWGVWIIEFAFLVLTINGLYFIAVDRWGRISSLVVLFFWFFSMKKVGSYYHFGDSNYIETYGLLFAVWAIAFWLQALKQKKIGPEYFFIGIMAGLSFALRPNNIAVYLSIALIEMIVTVRKRNYAEYIKRMGILLLGFLLVGALILAWFWMKGAVSQLVDAVFVYNMAYARKNATNQNILSVLLSGLSNFYWIPLFASIGLVFRFVYVSVTSKLEYSTETLFLIFLIAGSLIEAVLSSISGRVLLHYYIGWTPFVGLLMAGLIFSFTQDSSSIMYRLRQNSSLQQSLSWAALLLFFIFNVSVFAEYLNIANDILLKQQSPEPKKALIEFIRNSTEPNDEVLVWGNDVWINFLTERKSPSLYSYQYPLFMPEYTGIVKMTSFLNDISDCPPVYIIEPIVNTDEILPLSQGRRNAVDSKLVTPEGLDKVYNYFDTNYQYVRDFNDVNIYKWIGTQNGNINCSGN